VAKGYLAPAGSERETYSYESKSNDHIPGPDIWDWVGSCGDVENYDPD